MKGLFRDIKSGIIIASSFVITLSIIGTIYAILNSDTWHEPSEVSSGDILTSASWNAMGESIKYLKEQIGDLRSENNALSGQLANVNNTLGTLTNEEGQIIPQTFVAPANAVVAFNLASCPEGWKPANGSNSTPDLRGKFIRGLNSFENGSNKLTGVNSDEDGVSRALESYQGDAIRNIIGEINMSIMTLSQSVQTSGVFYPLTSGANNSVGGGIAGVYYVVPGFDASRVVPVGSDNRPKNIALIYCVKE